MGRGQAVGLDSAVGGPLRSRSSSHPRRVPDAVIEHVGSTAVVNLPAKPIVDFLVGVATDDVTATVAGLTSLGYQTHTEKERGDRIFLWLGEGDVSRYHINVTQLGSDTWGSLLRFRDLLWSDTRVLRPERCEAAGR